MPAMLIRRADVLLRCDECVPGQERQAVGVAEVLVVWILGHTNFFCKTRKLDSIYGP